MQCIVKLATAMVIMIAGTPFFLVPTIVFLYIFVVLQDYFRPLARLLQRNAAADRSPVYGKFDQFLMNKPSRPILA